MPQLKGCSSAVTIAIFILQLLTPVTADTYVELLIDASGSMYNKFGSGTHRITAAKAMLSEFIRHIPQDEELHIGLRIFGSTVQSGKKGACTDSKLSVPLKGIAKNKLIADINKTIAKGSTPIAHSLKQAAHDFPEDGRKIVILITDGEESCNGDVGGTIARLKEEGIEIYLRTVGIDLPEDAAQRYRKLGAFVNTKTPEELAAGLWKSVVPDLKKYVVTVLLKHLGAPFKGSASITFVNNANKQETEFIPTSEGTFAAEINGGEYHAKIHDSAQDTVIIFKNLKVLPNAENSFTFDLEPVSQMNITITPADPYAGARIAAAYSGIPDKGGCWAALVNAKNPAKMFGQPRPVITINGEVSLQTPWQPQELLVQFGQTLDEGKPRIIGRSKIFSTKPAWVKVYDKENIHALSSFEVTFAGPNNQDDFVGIFDPTRKGSGPLSFAYTSKGSPVMISAPVDPGTYSVRYVSGNGTIELVTTQVSVKQAIVNLTSTDSVGTRETFKVKYSGSPETKAYLTIVEKGAAEGSHVQFDQISGEGVSELIAPASAGKYEIRHIESNRHRTLARKDITVYSNQITIEAPPRTVVGHTIEIAFNGDEKNGDYIVIANKDADPKSYIDFAYTSKGNPAALTAPRKPGVYEIRYIAGEQKIILARAALLVK